MKVARIAYTNTAPFFYEWPENEFELVPGVPSELSLSASRGDVIAGPIPIVEYWKMEKDFEPLLNFGICCPKKARSVLVFSKVPFSELNRVSIGVTRESSTSVRLCQTLIEQRYRNTVRFRKGLQLHDVAWLVIGDQALKMASQPRVQEWAHVTDLAAEWWDWHQLPFVFARWVIRRDTPQNVREKLEAVLVATFEKNMQRLPEVSRVAASQVDLRAEFVEEYLRGFDYRLPNDATRSMSLFRELSHRSMQPSGSLS